MKSRELIEAEFERERAMAADLQLKAAHGSSSAQHDAEWLSNRLEHLHEAFRKELESALVHDPDALHKAPAIDYDDILNDIKQIRGPLMNEFGYSSGFGDDDKKDWSDQVKNVAQGGAAVAEAVVKGLRNQNSENDDRDLDRSLITMDRLDRRSKEEREAKQAEDRAKLIRNLAIGGGVLIAGLLIMKNWNQIASMGKKR